MTLVKRSTKGSPLSNAELDGNWDHFTALVDALNTALEELASSGVGTNLSVDRTATSATILSSSGNDATLPVADPTFAGLLSAALFSKLIGVATGATANSPDATLLDRGNHTGVQLAATISDFSTAVAGTAAVLARVQSASVGAANGVAPLGSDSKVPSAYLPSYVDDVLEYANVAAFPATGETGKIYVAIDTNKPYRWSGSVYVEISASPGSTDVVTEGSTNLYFTVARVRAAVLTGIDLGTNAAVLATDTVLQAIGKLSARLEALVTSVGAKASRTQQYQMSFIVATVANGDIARVHIELPVTIDKITADCASGSFTLTGKVNSTALGGTANSVTTSKASQTHSSANTAAAGTTFVLTASANSAALGATITVLFTRTLDA